MPDGATETRHARARAREGVDAVDRPSGQRLEVLGLEGNGVAGGVVEERAPGEERRAAVATAVGGGVGGRLRGGRDLLDRHVRVRGGGADEGREEGGHTRLRDLQRSEGNLLVAADLRVRLGVEELEEKRRSREVRGSGDAEARAVGGGLAGAAGAAG